MIEATGRHKNGDQISVEIVFSALEIGERRLFVCFIRDISERNDQASRRQDVAQRLRALLDAWEKEVDAEAVAGGFKAAPPTQN